MPILRVESHVHVNLAIISLRQRHEQSRSDGLARDGMNMLADDADNFHVVRRAVLWRLRVTNMLSYCVLIGEKLFRLLFVTEGNPAGFLFLSFFLSKIAAAQYFYAERIKVARRRRR